MSHSSAWRRAWHGTSRFALRWTRRALLTVGVLRFAAAAGFAAYAVLLLPDLDPWHTDLLEHEFDAARDARLDFAGYQALEQKLFSQLQAWQAAHATTPGIPNTRFDPQGAPLRLAGGAPFNRSYRLAVTTGPVRGAALLVHGLTDSPYSMRPPRAGPREHRSISQATPPPVRSCCRMRSMRCRSLRCRGRRGCC